MENGGESKSKKSTNIYYVVLAYSGYSSVIVYIYTLLFNRFFGK